MKSILPALGAMALSLALATVAGAAPPTHCNSAGADSQPCPAVAAPLPVAAMHEAAKAVVDRMLQFEMVVKEAASPSGDTLVLLHGSGGSPTTLIPLAAKFAPHAQLVGIGGRVVQDGKRRWYQRITPVTFDQSDIRAEAAAFADFLRAAVEARKLDLARTTFVGYSNGANLLAALSVLHPGLVKRAVLLRPMPVLDSAPPADLTSADFLTVVGKTDKLYAPYGPALETMLRQRGARVAYHTVGRGHGLGEEDVAIVSQWLASAPAEK